MILNEDFFDDVESTDVVNDEIEISKEIVNPDNYTHMIMVTLEIAENAVMKNVREQKSPEIDEFTNTLKNIIRKIEYILDADKFVVKHSNIIINHNGVNPLDDAINIQGLEINTNSKYGFRNIHSVDLLYYATFNITNAKQAVRFYSQHYDGFLNKNTMFYVKSLTTQRTGKETYPKNHFYFETGDAFYEIQEHIYDLCSTLSDRKDIYANILKCYNDDNAAVPLFEYEYQDFTPAIHAKNLMLKDKTIASRIIMFDVPYFDQAHTIECGYLEKPVWKYDEIRDWMKNTPFRLYTLVLDDERLEYIVMCVFNGTYIHKDKEYVIGLMSKCMNMSELDGCGDKDGFYLCLKMIQSLGYSEEDALDILKSDFDSYDETVYEEYLEHPELFGRNSWINDII